MRGIDRRVLRGVTFSVERGRSYGLVGESGCGKSTAALGIVRALPRNGRITFGGVSVAGRDVLALGARATSRLPRADRLDGLPEPRLRPESRHARRRAGGGGLHGARRPREGSGGAGPGGAGPRADRRPVFGHVPLPAPALGRACSSARSSRWRSRRIPSSSSSTSRRRGSMRPWRRRCSISSRSSSPSCDTAVLFISHNLGVISKMCDRVGVLYAGRLVEEGPVETVLQDPRHPYTVGLLRCIPRGGVRKDHGRLDTIPGFLPSLGAHLPGCVFADRCALADERCHTDEPPLFDVDPAHMSRCWYHDRAQELPREMALDLELPRVDRSATPLVEISELDEDVQAARARGARARGRRAPRSGAARPSGSSASREAGRRRSRGPCSASSRRRAASRRSTERSSRPGSRSARGRSSARCRSSSRTPTRRSTDATRCDGSSSAR